MRLLKLSVGLALIGLAAIPGARRWSAERALYRASAALQIVVTSAAQVPDREATLRWVADEAEHVSRRLPGDVRPMLLGGSACLVARDADCTLAWYARALAAGERAEIDLNIGRAYMLRRELQLAQGAFLRAGWLTPAVLEALPSVAREPLRAELDRLWAELAAGRLAEAPPPPRP